MRGGRLGLLILFCRIVIRFLMMMTRCVAGDEGRGEGESWERWLGGREKSEGMGMG